MHLSCSGVPQVEQSRRSVLRCLIAVMASAVGGVACTPAFNWREVRNLEHRFSVLLPARVAQMTRTIDLDGVALEMTMVGARAEQALFSVGAATLPRDDAALREHALAAMRTAMLNNIAARQFPDPARGPASRARAVKMTDASGAVVGAQDGIGIEAAGRVAGEAVVLHAVFVARGERIWQAVAIVPPGLSEQAQTMLDSFRIIV